MRVVSFVAVGFSFVLLACADEQAEVDDLASTPSSPIAPVEAPSENATPTIATGSTSAPELDVNHGCGYGFWIGDEAEEWALLVELEDHEAARSDQIPPISDLVQGPWGAQLLRGIHLFENHCNDVELPDPQRQMYETLELTSGTLHYSRDATVAWALITDLEASGPDSGVIQIERITGSNAGWGVFAG